MNKLHIKFSAPLNPGDSEETTFGCRANNPDICKYAFLEGVCAFANNDRLCRQPSKAWKKQFAKLKEASNGT